MECKHVFVGKIGKHSFTKGLHHVVKKGNKLVCFIFAINISTNF